MTRPTGVARGQLGVGTGRRALAATQSEPVLSFSNYGTTSGSNGGFQTFNDTLDSVYGAGPRANELRPMFETGPPVDPSSQRTGSFASFSATSRSGTWSNSGSFQTRETTTEYAAPASEAGHDGFDLDEVYGRGSADQESEALQLDSQATVSSAGTARTITTGLKRALDDDTGDQPIDGDEDMADTDVEDEVEDSFKPMWEAPAGRPLAGRQGLAKTMSMPAELFSNTSF